MALCALCGRVLLIFQVLQLSSVHSSLISETCESWRPESPDVDRFEDVDFDEHYELTKSDCGKELALDELGAQAPTVTYPNAVRLILNTHLIS